VVTSEETLDHAISLPPGARSPGETLGPFLPARHNRAQIERAMSERCQKQSPSGVHRSGGQHGTAREHVLPGVFSHAAQNP
jgi:hypothetical protein